MQALLTVRVGTRAFFCVLLELHLSLEISQPLLALLELLVSDAFEDSACWLAILDYDTHRPGLDDHWRHGSRLHYLDWSGDDSLGDDLGRESHADALHGRSVLAHSTYREWQLVDRHVGKRILRDVGKRRRVDFRRDSRALVLGELLVRNDGMLTLGHYATTFLFADTLL
jgi:hypothetical protein